MGLPTQEELLLGMLPKLLGKINPAVRELIASIAELAQGACCIGPEDPAEPYALLYAWAEDQVQLPQGILAAFFAVLPLPPIAADAPAEERARYRDQVLQFARELQQLRDAHGLARALPLLIASADSATGVARSSDPERDAGYVAGIWQLFIARRLDPSAAEGLARMFRG